MKKGLRIKGAFLSLLFSAVFALSVILNSCSVSTANLSDVKLCNSSGEECSSDMSSFSPDVENIVCSAHLNNAPEKTKVTFEWKQGGESIGTATVEAGSGVIHSNFKPSAPLPAGKYSVTIKINTDNSKPVTKEFTVSE